MNKIVFKASPIPVMRWTLIDVLCEIEFPIHTDVNWKDAALQFAQELANRTGRYIKVYLSGMDASGDFGGEIAVPQKHKTPDDVIQDVIEFRTDEYDYRELTWDTRPVVLELPSFVYDSEFQQHALALIAQSMANVLQVEVRWSFRGSQQGHYFDPQQKP